MWGGEGGGVDVIDKVSHPRPPSVAPNGLASSIEPCC